MQYNIKYTQHATQYFFDSGPMYSLRGTDMFWFWSMVLDIFGYYVIQKGLQDCLKRVCRQLLLESIFPEKG